MQPSIRLPFIHQPGKLYFLLFVSWMTISDVCAEEDTFLINQEVSYALHFDGKDGVTIPKLDLHNRKRLTIEGFVTPTDFPKPGQAWSTIGGQVLDVRLVNKNNKVSWQYEIQLAGAPNKTILSDEEVKANERVHLAIVWDGEHVYCFLNGKLQAEPIEVLELKRGKQDNLYIACSQLRANFFRGSIDEIRFAEWAVYTEPFTPPEAPLKLTRNTLGLYHLDEGKGLTMADSSGNKRDGQIKGARWITLKP